VIGVKVTTSYESNVNGLTRKMEKKLERIVARAARDGSAHIRSSTQPTINAYATEGFASKGVVQAGVWVSKSQWWAGIEDKGSLGKRKVPREPTGKRKSTWKIKRRGRLYIAHRHPEALLYGGREPQYFLIRGKRVAERSLAKYVVGGL
jgi:hypothetical protein